MSDKASSAKAAEYILLAFEGASAGNTISYQHVEDYFRRHRLPLQESASGLHYGRHQGWIMVNSFHSITLLPIGLEKLNELTNRSGLKSQSPGF